MPKRRIKFSQGPEEDRTQTPSPPQMTREIPFGEGAPALRCHYCRNRVNRVSSVYGKPYMACDRCKAKFARKQLESRRK